MANEAVLFHETSLPIQMTVANANGIEQGTLLALVDPYTASGVHTVNSAFAGIAAQEKISNDGTTKLAVYRGGIFKVVLSGSCTVGDSLTLSATQNMVRSAQNNTAISGANIVGTALETGATGETILADIHPQTVRFA